MKCNKVKDLIMDYIDGEVNEATRKEVACHLDACALCKRIEQSLRSNIVEPLRKSLKAEVPDTIWCEIQDALARKKTKLFLPYLLFGWMDYLRIKRPVLVPAALAITILFFVAALYFRETLITNNTVSAYMREELQFLSQLSGNGEDSFVIVDIELGTSVEKYFL